MKSNKKCDWCGIQYKFKNKKQRFCSIECLHEWQRNSDEYKELFKPSLSEFIEQIEIKYPFMEYHSGFKNREGRFKYRCKLCGVISEVTCQIVRPSWKKKTKCATCDMLRIKDGLKNKANQKNEKMLVKKLIREEKDKLARIQSNHKYFNECNECGKNFFSRTNKLTCSRKCEKKRNNRLKELKRRKMIYENGFVDTSISLDKLIERDEGVCHICTKECDKNDYTITPDGHFVAGANYPSIDHLTPISKGGTHTWNNIKLAHMYCNTMKSDGIVYENHKGLLTLAI